MNLAFYYHIEIGISKNGILTAPGFIGVFIDSLASKVDKFYLVAHTINKDEDYVLKSSNIVLVDLGKPKPAWYRHYFHIRILSSLKFSISDADAFLVRSPSPLAPFFTKYVPKKCKIIYYVVGSYLSGANEMKIQSFREILIQIYLRRNHKLFIRELKGKEVLVNSPEIEKSLNNIAKEIHLIPTTTLSNNDIYFREDTCVVNKIQLIYSGRFDWQKGLKELIYAFAELHKLNSSFQLNLVGWEDGEDKPVEKELRNIIALLNLNEFVIFHGKKKVGEELSKMYRMADIFILPSYHEGFPRTIWEAQANSLPVISTKVGAIPVFLEHLEDVYLIQPKSSKDIVEAVMVLLTDSILRRKIIKNAFKKAKLNTLDNRSTELINYVEKII